MSVSKVNDDFTAEECVMVCPALTPVSPPPLLHHICLIFSSSEKVWVAWGREWVTPPVIRKYRRGPSWRSSVCSFERWVCFPEVELALRWVSPHKSLWSDRSVSRSRLDPFMVRNVNKNIAWDRVIKTDAWRGDHHITGDPTESVFLPFFLMSSPVFCLENYLIKSYGDWLRDAVMG